MHKQACALCTNIRFKWLWDFFQIPYTHLPLENSAEPYRSPYINFYTFNSVCLKATGWFVPLTHNAQHTRIQPSCCLRIAELSYVACQSTPTHTHTHRPLTEPFHARISPSDGAYFAWGRDSITAKVKEAINTAQIQRGSLSSTAVNHRAR